jgi:mitochondrial fission protein ELM1
MKVLWIKDSKVGHLNKARGLLRALGERAELELIEYDVDWRWSFLRQPLSWIGKAGLALDAGWFVRGLPKLEGIDLVVSAGGATQWPNAAITRQNGIRNVFLGSPRSIGPECFSLIASHDAPSGEESFFRFELIPSVVTRGLAAKAATDAGLEVGVDLGLLLGGNGEGVFWVLDDYELMAREVIRMAKERGVGAWIATSRRTPREVEARVREILAEPGLPGGGGCWVHQRQAGGASLLAMMGACGHLFVTADSMSMTHEAISAGAKVVILLPSADGNSRLMGNLRELEKAGWGVTQRAAESWGLDAMPQCGWQEVPADPCAELANAVVKALGNAVEYEKRRYE